MPVICVHVDLDEIVLVSQSENYVSAATSAGDPAQLLVVPGADHNSIIDISGPGWEFARDRILKGI